MSIILEFLVFWTALYAVLRALLWRRLRLFERIQRIRDERARSAENFGARKPVSVASGASAIGWALPTVSHWLFLRSVLRHVTDTWERLGYRITSRDWTAAGMIAALLALLGVFMTRSVWGILLTLPLSSGLYTTLLVSVRKHRARELDAHLCHMLVSLSGALRAGHSFLQALEVALRETGGPLAHELERLLRELSLGVSFEDALTHASARIASRDFDLVSSALLVQRQVGGNLAGVLDTACDTIRERLRLAGELRALTAQGRLSMWIFLLLTPGMALMLFVMNPSYISALWQTEQGVVLIVLSIAGQVIGALFIRRIVRVTV